MARKATPRSVIQAGIKRGTNKTFSWAKMKEAYPPNWPEIAAECKRLANYRCAECGTRYPPPFQGQLQAHHIRSASKSGTSHAQSNLKALCHACHQGKHKHSF